MRQVRAEPHKQFTGIDVFIARCCLNCHVDAIEAANTPESYRYWFWRSGDELKADVQE
jgi:cbb3-type cytochrome oxidase cytochrome c subunit